MLLSAVAYTLSGLQMVMNNLTKNCLSGNLATISGLGIICLGRNLMQDLNIIAN
jgi:hypothetical protein